MLSREAILGAALALLEEEGLGALSMRAVARRLKVDAMAPYHYFPDRESLLRAAAECAYTKLSLRMPCGSDWRRNLERLAAAYLRLLAPARQLLLVLSAQPELAQGPARIFEAHFKAAVSPLKLSKSLYRAALSAYVDLIHGFALALFVQSSESQRPSLRAASFKAELGILLTGLAVMAEALPAPSITSVRPRRSPTRAPNGLNPRRFSSISPSARTRPRARPEGRVEDERRADGERPRKE